MSSPDTCQMALKEWAITVEALSSGDQVLLLRKGGIHEDGKDFRVIHREFVLYPTYEHQKAELLQPGRQPALQALLERPRDPEKITFSHFARAEEVLEVADQEKVDDLQPHYIWTKEYAQSRLHWKPMLPLTIMLLRVYQMAQPVTVPYYKEYSGCTSWVEILDQISLGERKPVLSDQEFYRRVDEIKGSLGLVAAAG